MRILDPGSLEEVIAQPQLHNRKVAPVALDLRSEDSIRQAIAQTAQALGSIGVLVNNAGVPLQKPATEVTWSEWDAVIDVNLKGGYFLATAFARHCRDGGCGGAVVNIASTHGLTGIADRSVYGISKGGIIQMTRMLAIEWAPLGIRVNAVAPATVLTPSREKMLSDPDARARMLARIPLGRFVTPEDRRRRALSRQPGCRIGDRTYAAGRRRGDCDVICQAAAADLPIAAFTRGITSSAINCIERLLSAGSTQSMPA